MAMRHKGLAKLAEEIGELGQVVGKRLQYPEGPHPDEYREKPLDERMEDEIGDVIAACWFVVRKRELDKPKVVRRMMEKQALFAQWDMELASPVFQRGSLWCFEGEYHTEEFETEEEATTAARAYDEACKAKDKK